MMAKKRQIRQYVGFKEVWTGRGSGSKVKSQVKFAQEKTRGIVPSKNWYAERGTTMFWNPKKGKATPRKWWKLGYRDD